MGFGVCHPAINCRFTDAGADPGFDRFRDNIFWTGMKIFSVLGAGAITYGIWE
jgi:hypothetical protein